MRILRNLLTKDRLYLLNALFFCVNILFVLLVLADRLRQRHVFNEATETASHLGMEAAYVDGPLSLYLNEGFPRKDGLNLFDKQQLLSMSRETVDPLLHNGATRRAAMSLNVDFEVACYYSFRDGIRVKEVALTTSRQLLIDMNADGVFDQRVIVPDDVTSEAPVIQVWDENRWRDSKRGRVWGVRRRELADGDAVEFDDTTGRWLAIVRRANNKTDKLQGTNEEQPKAGVN